MARLVEEIMNREVFSLRPAEEAADALGYIVALGVNGAPVIDETGALRGVVSLRDLLADRGGTTVAERMTSPPVVVEREASIEEAGRLLGETGLHRLVVVDDDGAPVGVVSALDVVRGLCGLPAGHPATFPHFDPDTGVTWTDDRPLDLDRVEAAPDGPGVLALVRGGAGVSESVVWVEAVTSSRRRLIDVISLPAEQTPQLRRVLAFRDLRFRCAEVPEPREREVIVSKLMASARNALR